MNVEVISVEPVAGGFFRVTYRLTIGATVFSQVIVLKQTIALEVVEANPPTLVQG